MAVFDETGNVGLTVVRWRILVLLFLARVGLGFQFQTVVSLGDDLGLAFDYDQSEIGVLIGLFMAPGLFLALPAGLAGGYASDRVLATVGLGALAFGGVVSALAMEGWVLGLGRLLAGVGFLLSTLYFTKMVADWFEGREIATAMSVLVMSWPLGIALGQIGHVWLAERLGWPAAFLAASAYCALAAASVALLYRPPGNRRSEGRRLSFKLSAGEWRLILAAGAAWGLLNAGYVVYLTFGPMTLVALGDSGLGAAATISVASWIMILSGTLCGQIADRFGRRDAILALCMTAAVVALSLLSLSGAGLAASLLFGLLGMAPAGLVMALAGEAVPAERRAFAMGIFFTLYYAIMAVTPPISGWIYDTTGRADAPLVLGMLLFASVVPAGLLFRIWKCSASAEGVRA
ncbi:MAG: hypothetical protein Kilf2KO_44940 [Rhodospirillales bacterium]